MVKNKFTLIIAFLILSATGFNQEIGKDNRTLQTKIADLLAQMPATDQAYLNILMNNMASLGEEGLVEMAGMLIPPGKGNDAGVRFAIGSFSGFVVGPGQEEKRILCQKAWCKALENEPDNENKAFLIAQIQMVGHAFAIPYLEKYLLLERFSDPAARALASINTPEAGRVLTDALDKVQESSQISLVEALGNMQYAAAASKITALASSANARLRKVSLFTLARFGLPESGALLYDAALKSGFVYEPTQATSSYLLWLSRLIEIGNNALAEKKCIELVNICTADNQVQTRSEALSMLVKSSGEKATPFLYAALKSNSQHYRVAALGLAQNLKGEKLTLGYVKKAGKLTGQPKAEVIDMLGERGDTIALPFIKKALADQDETARLAAIKASAKLGKDSALPDLFGVMKKGNPAEIAAVKTQLLSFHGNTLMPLIIKEFPNMPAQAKIALMEVLASRKSSDHVALVLQQTDSQDPAVKLAALKALPDLVSEKDLGELYRLLRQATSPEELSAVQTSVIAAVKGLSPEKQAASVLSTLNNTSGADRSLFYGILAGIGNDQALKPVVRDFTEGKPELKNAAFEALTNWSNPQAIHELYLIGSQPGNSGYREASLKAILKLISQSDYPDDQRLLLLRKISDLAILPTEKSLILKETGRCGTYLGLQSAAKYLDDPDLQQDAAMAVSDIALGNKSLYGSDVKDVLNKALNLMKGPESEYQKEAIRKHLASLPDAPGFLPLFNGRDLTGWKGLVENPIIRSTMKPADLAKAQVKADEIMQQGWKVENGILVFTGNGNNLCTVKQYGDFEMLVDWKITAQGDAGIYLRGSPQVQIWDTSRREAGAQVGSGGLYNNQVYERNPLKVADNPVGDWNSFRIIMQGERVTVYLNGILVVDNVIMENYWDRSIPIFPVEQLELQAHGTWVGYRDIYVREIPRAEPYRVSATEKAEGYAELFDGISMFNWTGNTRDYIVENGCIAVYPESGGGGNLYTKAEYGDFSFRFEFQLTPGANNGIGIRTPLEGDAAYVGMEIQVLDNTADIYRNLKPYQYHGSVYGVIPARREYLKPVGEWNSEEIIARGNHIQVILNGTTIVDGDIAEASANGTLDHNDHPGLKNSKGHIGFLGHGSVVKFRNLRIKDLTSTK
jgi:HEAT repeat protein